MRILGFFKGIWNEKSMMIRLAKNDFKARYAGSFLGVIWAFVQPLVTILVFWFVFEKGFRMLPINNVNYILWFVPAYIPWIFFSDILASSTNCINEYNYLVKKVKFRVGLLPLIKILSASLVHIFFIGLIFVLYLINKGPLSIYNLQALYYSFALIMFSLGLSFLFSALSVFFKDLPQLVSVLLQIGFWINPILWNVDSMDPTVVEWLQLNPMYYVINGYRDSFINYVPFWHQVNNSIYFWICTFVFFVIGGVVFTKLKPHFADEL